MSSSNEGSPMKTLSYESEIRAADTLAHYLKENVSLGDASARQEGERAARNIRAAFEALEGGDSANESSRKSKPLDEHDLKLRKLAAEASLAVNRLSRELPPAATSSQTSPQTGQSEDVHRA